MSVPLDHLLCRFIQGSSSHWNDNDGIPRVGAFKDKREPSISVWNANLLAEKKVRIEQLLKDALKDYGRVYLTVQDCFDAALEAENVLSEPFGIIVVPRTEDDYVAKGWREWAYAHVQIEYSGDKRLNHVVQEFRRCLVRRVKDPIPPVRYRT